MATNWGTQTLSYDEENRLVGVSGPVTATLSYDGQGHRVLRRMASGTRLYLDDYFEGNAGYSAWVRYYYLNGQRIAQRKPSGVIYLHSDHLGSTSATTGASSSKQLYFPYGAQRWEEAIGL